MISFYTLNQTWPENNKHKTLPFPEETGDDDLVCDGLHCIDMEPESWNPDQDQAWQCSFYVSDQDIDNWRSEENPNECGFWRPQPNAKGLK